MADNATAPLLTTDTVCDYVAKSLAGKPNLPLDPSATLSATAIDDGNLNFAFCVAEAANPSRAVFVKQAPGFIKCLGEDFKLGAERMLVESAVMEEYTAAVPAHVRGDGVPAEPRNNFPNRAPPAFGVVLLATRFGA